MGLIAVLKSFSRVIRNGANVSDVKVDAGGGDNKTAEHFSAPGDDSSPLPGDYAMMASTRKSGGLAAVGYIDPANEHITGPGGKRIYSRSENGVIVADIWLKNDGSIAITGIDIVTVNGLIISISGAVNTNGSIDGIIIKDNSVPLGVMLATHTHPGPGLPPTPGT